MSESAGASIGLRVHVRSWQITRRRFRPTFKDRFIDLASVIPGLVQGPKTSFRERHVQMFPHLLAIGAAVSPGMYGVRRAHCSGSPVTGADLELLTRRLWHAQDNQLCTELGDAELQRWTALSARPLTLLIEAVPSSTYPTSQHA